MSAALVWHSPRSAAAASSSSSSANNNADAAAATASGSNGSNTAPSTRHTHTVAFGRNASPFMMLQQSHSHTDSAGHAAVTSGGSSGFGFGFGHHQQQYHSQPAASGSGSGWSLTRSPPPPAASSSNGNASNRRRRRRSDSSSEEMMQTHSSSHANAEDASTGGKRARRELRPIRSMANLGGTSAAGGAQIPPSSPTAAATPNATGSSSGADVDVGKALASLSKPALLSVFTSLLSSHPSLKPAVLALLPAPSLESFSAQLQAHERRVLDALPFGYSAAGGVRQEYVYTRIRAPLEEYVAEARLALGQFCSPQAHGQGQDDPATIFAFLYMLTLSVRKLELLLPRAPAPFSSAAGGAVGAAAAAASVTNPSTLNHRDPLISLLPALFNQWHTLITRLASVVNQHGRVLGAEMLRGWFRNLDSLVDPPMLPAGGAAAAGAAADAVGRRAAEAVRERFVRELGWLVGIRPAQQQGFGNTQLQQPANSSTSSLANQMADSKMMDNGEDSDVEL